MPRLKILHVYGPSAGGGLDRVVEGLAVGQRQRGHDVAIAAICGVHGYDSTSLQRMRSAGVAIHPIVVSPRGYAGEWRGLVDVCRRVGPDVVHTHGARTDVIDGGAALSRRVPTVTTMHGRTGGGMKWRIFEWLQHRVVGWFDAVVAVSQPQVAYLLKCGVRPEKIRVIPNAWTPFGEQLDRHQARELLEIRGDVPTIGWVGRLSHEKGADVFVKALAQLSDVNVSASILGDGGASAEVMALAAELGVGDRIRWHGMVNDAGRLFRAFDLFVLSSRTEGTPIALFEAIAAELPIVATSVGGVPDVVSEREAMLVPSDDPTALANAIRASLADAAEACGRVERATERLASHFGATEWLSRYENVYQSILSARK
jgi:glycosyltransferase involved in cell wall biosynthesis